jgi:subtilisin family serine protease
MADGPPKQVESRTAVTAPRSMEMNPDNDRYIVDASTVDMDDMEGYTIVHDLSDEIGYVVVKGDESWMPESAEYMPDAEIEIERPVKRQSLDEGAQPDGLDPGSSLQWDKLEQNAGAIPPDAGSGARIGVIDSGVLGANSTRTVEHPDLPKGSTVLQGSGEPNDEDVYEGPSYSFTNDGTGPGPYTGGEFNTHGTEVAGTAAAADNDFGVAGLAPGAEIVDLRVFPGEFASTGDIIAAIVTGATPRDVTVDVTVGEAVEDEEDRMVRGSGCDVINLSLGVPPLVPIETGDGEEPPDLPGPLIAVSPDDIDFFANVEGSAAAYARSQGTLPVASAGNSGVGLGIPLSDDRQVPELQVPGIDAAPVTFPANAPGFVSVGACGPIGYGWSTDSDAPFDRTELPTQELAQYTNYGSADPAGTFEAQLGDGLTETQPLGTAVDVTAGGGNFDSGALAQSEEIGSGEPFFDALYTTTFTGGPGEESDPVDPTFIFTAGTSFSAPNVSGLAALLYSELENPSPGDVQSEIVGSAEQLPVGRAGETTSPSVGAANNAALDSRIDGDAPSAPGSVPGRLDPTDHRGNGHIDVLAALGIPQPSAPASTDD